MVKTPLEKPDGEQMSESYISVGLGLLVVVVVGILLYNYFAQKSAQNKSAEQTNGNVTQEATSTAKPGGTYTVVDGDTLWSISEKSYGTGYNWEEIAKANNLTQTDQLAAGQQLVIPEVSPKPTETSTIEQTPTTSPESNPVAMTTPAPQVSITESTYTVVAGDTLWDIACRAYGDCYAWPRIVQANSGKIVNPDLIYAGDTLNLPR